MNKYKNFSIEDFLQDEFFNQWVKNPLMKDAELWERWLNNNPEMTEVVEEARNILLAFNEPPIRVRADFYERLKSRIDTTISNDRNTSTTKIFIANWLKFAAVLIGLIIAGSLLFSSPTDTIYTSKYGEIKKVLLPDGSEVVLNANSSIKYTDSSDKNYREVWLTGEAFFKVKHIEDQNKVSGKFIVHTKDLNVEVLGTEFNVNSVDGSETEVLLTKGKVRLSVVKQGSDPINMIPNEKVLYNNKTKNISVNKVTPRTYIAWMDHKFTFEKTTVEDLTKVLRRYYGKSVSVYDTTILQQRLSGTLELQDERTLIKTLSALLGVRVDTDEHQIIIHAE